MWRTTTGLLHGARASDIRTPSTPHPQARSRKFRFVPVLSYSLRLCSAGNTSTSFVCLRIGIGAYPIDAIRDNGLE